MYLVDLAWTAQDLELCGELDALFLTSSHRLVNQVLVYAPNALGT